MALLGVVLLIAEAGSCLTVKAKIVRPFRLHFFVGCPHSSLSGSASPASGSSEVFIFYFWFHYLVCQFCFCFYYWLYSLSVLYFFLFINAILFAICLD